MTLPDFPFTSYRGPVPGQVHYLKSLNSGGSSRLGANTRDTYNRSSSRAIAFCNLFARTTSICAVGIGVAVLIGWQFNVQLFKSVAPGWVTMKANSALAFMLAGTALWLVVKERANPVRQRDMRLAQICAWAVLVVGGLTLAEYLLGVNLGIDEILVLDGGQTYRGRMSELTAAGFLLVGTVLLLLRLPSRRPVIWTAQILTHFAGFSAFVSVTDHLYGNATLQAVGIFQRPAFHSSIMLLVLCAGLLCARPTEGIMELFTAESAGGAIVRRLLLPVVLLPVTLNWMELSAERNDLVPTGFAYVLNAYSTVLFVGLMVWVVAWRVHQRDVAQLAGKFELQSSEERYRKLVEMSPDGILVHDHHGIQLANPAALRVFGGNQCEDILGKSLSAFILPEFRAAFEQRLYQALEQDVNLPMMEHRVLRPDGTSLDVELSATPVKYHGRRVVQIIVHDISERKRFEEELRKSIERFELVARATNDAVWDWEITVNRSWWNDAMYEHFGYDRNTTPSYEAWIERIHPEDRENVTASFQRVLEYGHELPWAEEYRFRMGDGSYGYVYDRGYVVRDAMGNPIRMLGAMMDVTANKRMQAAQKESERRFRLIAETITEVFWMTDAALEIVMYVSPACEAVWGRTRDSIYDTPRFFLDAIHLEDRDRVLTHLQLQKVGLLPFDHEYRIIRPDGSMRWIWDRGFPVTSEAGNVVHYVGVAKDITERKRKDAILRQTASSLRNLSKRLLQAQESERREIARELHDDFGQTLTVLEMNLLALRDSVSDSGQLFLEQSLDTVGNLLESVHNLALDLHPAILDHLGLVPALEWYLGQYEQHLGLTWELCAPEGMPRVRSELETACYRIVQESLTNIVRHAGAGLARVELKCDGDGLQLRIKDDGVGFDVAAMRDQARSGRSIGLLGMEERATLAGGSLEVISSPGQGTEVRVWFPSEPSIFRQNGSAPEVM